MISKYWFSQNHFSMSGTLIKSERSKFRLFISQFSLLLVLKGVTRCLLKMNLISTMKLALLALAMADAGATAVGLVRPHYRSFFVRSSLLVRYLFRGHSSLAVDSLLACLPSE